MGKARARRRGREEEREKKVWRGMIAVNGDEGDVTEQGTMDSGGREIGGWDWIAFSDSNVPPSLKSHSFIFSISNSLKYQQLRLAQQNHHLLVPTSNLIYIVFFFI